MENAVSRIFAPVRPPRPFIGERFHYEPHVPAFSPNNRLAAGESLFSVGDVATAPYLIHEGTIMVMRRLPGGRRQILDLAGRGRTIGFAAGARHDCDAVALSAASFTSVICSPKDQLEAVVAEIARLRDLATLLGRKTAIERLASFLTGLIDDDAEGSRAIVLPVSRRDIADHLGLVIETVCRNLRQMKQQGLIDLQGNFGVILRNPPELRRIACGDRHDSVNALVS